MKFRFAVLCACITLFATAPAWAGTITYNFTNCPGITNCAAGVDPGDQGAPPTTFTAGGVSIKGYGVGTSGSIDLYLKAGGTDESGLGLNATSDNEINPGQEIVFDVSNLLSSGYTNGSVNIGSLQSNEGAKVCDSDTLADAKAGTHLTNCTSQIVGGGNSIGSANVSWSSGDSFLVFQTDNNSSAPNGNFLIMDLQASSATPEPASLLLMGTGLLGLALLAKRHGAKASC